MADYISLAGGYLNNPDATSDCQFCAIQSTDVFLANFNMSLDNAWRDFGVMMIYCVFNIFAAIGIYYWVRVVSLAALLTGVDLG